MIKVFETLDKLEECANGMKDLPKSNWIDLAENEAELDEKIFSWVEEIKFELFKGKQALTELKSIKEAKPSEALECLNCLERLHDCGVFNYEEMDDYNTIKQTLLKAQELEKELADVEKVKSGKIIIYFGKDLVMMNKNKYYDYLELEKEPISKRILQAKCEEQEKELNELNQHIKRWHDLLLKTGINSKGTVVDEIENYWQIKVESKNEK